LAEPKEPKKDIKVDIEKERLEILEKLRGIALEAFAYIAFVDGPSEGERRAKAKEAHSRLSSY
jgi:hypothetical protein